MSERTTYEARARGSCENDQTPRIRFRGAIADKWKGETLADSATYKMNCMTNIPN